MVNCPLTKRQKQLYDGIKKKISIEDLLQSANASSSQSQSTTSSLMNLVMQFRKVRLATAFQPNNNSQLQIHTKVRIVINSFYYEHKMILQQRSWELVAIWRVVIVGREHCISPSLNFLSDIVCHSS